MTLGHRVARELSAVLAKGGVSGARVLPNAQAHAAADALGGSANVVAQYETELLVLGVVAASLVAAGARVLAPRVRIQRNTQPDQRNH